jgi:hypothetical protein
MENRVGDAQPSEKEVEKILKLAKELASALQPYTVHLTAEERHRALKPRADGERVTAQVLRLAGEHKLELSDVPVDGIQADLTLAQRMAPIAEALDPIVQSVADTMLQARSEAWWGTTAYYTALQGIARSNPQLKTALQPAVDFFALGRRKPKAPVAK